MNWNIDWIKLSTLQHRENKRSKIQDGNTWRIKQEVATYV